MHYSQFIARINQNIDKGMRCSDEESKRGEPYAFDRI